MRSKINFRVIFFLCFLTTGCASYKYNVRGAHLNFERGDFDRSLEILADTAKENESEALLFLLDQGTVAHAAGRFEESNRFFEKAEALADELDAISISGEAATVLVDERLLYYKGEDFEKLLINDFKALNYLMLAEQSPEKRRFYRDEALVECRRAQLRLDKLIKKGVKHFELDPLAMYLCGLTYELQGEWNDAYIAYQTLHEVKGDAPYIRPLLLSLSRRLSFAQEYEGWRQKFKGSIELKEQQKWENPASKGELILLIENGYAPEKIPHPTFHQLPTYERRAKSADSFEVLIDQQESAQSRILSDVADVAIEYMKKKSAARIAKRVAGAVTKEVIAYEVAKQTKSEAAGWATRLLLHSMTRADLRSWLTYPADFQIVRIHLNPGLHDVAIMPILQGVRQPDLQQTFEKIKILPHQKTVRVWRLLR